MFINTQQARWSIRVACCPLKGPGRPLILSEIPGRMVFVTFNKILNGKKIKQGRDNQDLVRTCDCTTLLLT